MTATNYVNTRKRLILAGCALCLVTGLLARIRPVLSAKLPVEHSRRNVGRVSALARALRPNYPYSVIPGGAYTPTELRYAAEHDPLVREHYADFNLKAARLVTLNTERYEYVSFRQKGKIYWTKRRLKISRGEVLLTDGRYYAKTRCGNRLSDVARSETSGEEVAASVLSPPPLRMDRLGGLTFAGHAPRGEFDQASLQAVSSGALTSALTPWGDASEEGPQTVPRDIPGENGNAFGSGVGTGASGLGEGGGLNSGSEIRPVGITGGDTGIGGVPGLQSGGEGPSSQTGSHLSAGSVTGGGPATLPGKASGGTSESSPGMGSESGDSPRMLAIPEPSAFVLLGICILGLVVIRSRQINRV